MNSNDKTTHLTIIITPVAGRPGAYAARLEGDPTVLVTSREPLLASARKLIAAGHPPDAVLMMRREGTKGFDLKARLGKAAKLTVEESAHGPVFRTFRDGPPSAMAGSPNPVPESPLGVPRLEAPAEPVVEEPSCAFGPPSVTGGSENSPSERPPGEPRLGPLAVEETASALGPASLVERSENLPPVPPPEEPRLDMPPEPVVEETFRPKGSPSAVEAASNAGPENPLGAHPDGTGHGAPASPMARKSAKRSVSGKGSRSAVEAASVAQLELPLGRAHDEAA